MNSSLKERYEYFKETGHYLSRQEVLYYLKSGDKYEPELVDFIKQSKSKLDETLEAEFNSILEYEKNAEAAMEAKSQIEQAKKEVEEALIKANDSRRFSEKMRNEAERAKDELAKSKDTVEKELEKEKLYAIQLQKGQKQGELAYAWVIAIVALALAPFFVIPVYGMTLDLTPEMYEFLIKLTNNHKDLMLLILGFVGGIFTTYFGMNKNHDGDQRERPLVLSALPNIKSNDIDANTKNF